jgi:hypothetical protein
MTVVHLNITPPPPSSSCRCSLYIANFPYIAACKALQLLWFVLRLVRLSCCLLRKIGCFGRAYGGGGEFFIIESVYGNTVSPSSACLSTGVTSRMLMPAPVFPYSCLVNFCILFPRTSRRLVFSKPCKAIRHIPVFMTRNSNHHQQRNSTYSGNCHIVLVFAWLRMEARVYKEGRGVIQLDTHFYEGTQIIFPNYIIRH